MRIIKGKLTMFKFRQNSKMTYNLLLVMICAFVGVGAVGSAAGKDSGKGIPPKPQGLVSKYVVKDGKRFVHLQWQPKDKTDKATSGYLLYKDNGKGVRLARQASLAPFMASEYLFEIKDKSQKTYTFGIAGHNRGKTGEIAKTKCVVLGKDQRNVEVVKLQTLAPGDSVEILWEFTGDFTPKGFRVFVKNEMVADETKISSDVRKWVVSGLAPNKIYRFEVQAVDKYDVLSGKSITKMYGTPFKFGVPDKPAGFEGAVVSQDGVESVKFIWSAKKRRDKLTGRFVLQGQNNKGVWEDVAFFIAKEQGLHLISIKDATEICNFRFMGETGYGARGDFVEWSMPGVTKKIEETPKVEIAIEDESIETEPEIEVEKRTNKPFIVIIIVIALLGALSIVIVKKTRN